MTQAQIETELTAVNAAILRITEQKTSTYSVQSRQVAFEGAGKLDALYKRQQYLEAQLSRLQANGGVPGIRLRYGVVRG